MDTRLPDGVTMMGAKQPMKTRRVQYDGLPAPEMSRRQLLRHTACGFGSVGLTALLAAESPRSASPPKGPLAPKQTHFAPRAKRVIFLFMHGGPSHVDTFDPKPRLNRDNGKAVRKRRDKPAGSWG